MTASAFQLIPIAELHESPYNPRKTYAQAPLAELALSIKEHGVLTPLIVRPYSGVGGGFEVGAGHRRLRAAQAAGLGQLPCVIQDLSDHAFLELLNIENLLREDIHPLEEADGYRLLMDPRRGLGYTVDQVAAKVGKSVSYVYQRLKLADLTPALRKEFLAGTITAGHAILLARLTPKQQAMVADRDAGGLFTHERLLWDPDSKDESDDPVKAVSVRELAAWIDEHVKFDAAQAPVEAQLFPETAPAAQVLAEAQKVIPITHAYMVPPTARDGVRVFTERSWKRADGTKGHKPCPHATAGLIVVGPGRGQAFKVCTSKDKCAIHWKAEQRESKARRARSDRPASGEDSAAAKARAEKQRAREELDRMLATETDKRFLAELLVKIKAPLPREAWLFLVEHQLSQSHIDIDELLAQAFDLGKIKKIETLKTEELPRLLVGLRIAEILLESYGPEMKRVVAFAKMFKVDRLQIAKEVEAEHKAQEKAAEAPKSKKKPKAKKAA